MPREGVPVSRSRLRAKQISAWCVGWAKRTCRAVAQRAKAETCPPSRSALDDRWRKCAFAHPTVPAASARPRHVRLATINGRLQEPLPCEPVGLLTQLLLERAIMKNLAIYLAAGASALLVTAASAAPLSPNVSVAPESNIQNVRMVCNESGRCWRQRGERRVIVREHRDSYGYAPRRERHIERRGYGGGGIGIHAPGVSVGIGTDRY